MKTNFEDFQIKKHDLISNAAYALACAIYSKDPDSDDTPLPWDMSVIGEMVDAAAEIMQRKGMGVCDPFYGGENSGIPCYLTGECKTHPCPFSHDENAE